MTAINSSKTAVIDRGYYWKPIDAGASIGMKMQLINKGAGVAHSGIYTGDKHWTHYAPLPTFLKEDQS
jgi:hypothetical protein